MSTRLVERLSAHHTGESALIFAARQVVMPTYSDGPFCRIEFFIDPRRGGLRTYTYRGAVYAEPARSLVNIITTLTPGGPSFSEVFIATDSISITRMVMP